MATVLYPVEFVDESGVRDWSAHEPSDGRAVVPPGSMPTTFTASTSHPDDVRLLGGTGDRPPVHPDKSEHPSVREHPFANPAPALLKRADLDRVRTVFPELLGLIDSLRSLEGEIRDGRRAASAEDTMSALSALEAMNRVTESIQATLLSRFHREGVPEKYGARSTRALLQERLKLSTREANRRDALARNVGERVGLDGGLMEPEYPLLAEALRSSAVSTDQVEAITRSVTKLPPLSAACTGRPRRRSCSSRPGTSRSRTSRCSAATSSIMSTRTAAARATRRIRRPTTSRWRRSPTATGV